MEFVVLSRLDIAELLRGHGMRSTPQRRAILSAFGLDRAEHLSADEVYARASQDVPELSRATVYATLAEFGELGLLSAFGSPEPVRYETKVTPHAHFRCRLCLRLFDLADGRSDQAPILDPGFVVERIETRAEGICAECSAYDTGLRAGARTMLSAGPPSDTLGVRGAAAAELASPLGALLLAATPRGLSRVAFEDHADAGALRAHADRRRGAQAARRHLADAAERLCRYFAGEVAMASPGDVDWEQLAPVDGALRASGTIPPAAHRSYSDLELPQTPRQLGLAFGANPIPILTPCHRVSRGTEIPSSFVGGSDRRRWLDGHELAHASA